MGTKKAGRIAAYEIMIATSAIRNLIREDKIAQLYSMLQTGQSEGMQTLDQCLERLVCEQVISINDAHALARDKNKFSVKNQWSTDLSQ